MPVQITSTLMQNHVAGVAPVPMKQLAVVCAGDQSPILFAVDDKDRLTVTLRDANQTTGWVQIPLSDQLAGMDGLGAAPVTQSFAATQDADGGIWLVLAVADGDPSHESRVYTSPQLSCDLTPEEWRQFAKLLVPRTTPAGVAFCELVLGSGDDGDGFPGIVAGTVIPMTGYVQQYVINPDPSDTTWTCVPFKMPDDTTYCLAVTSGKAPDLGRGIYALCATADPLVDSLTFTTLPTVGEHGEPHWTVRTFDLPLNYARTTTVALSALPVSDGLTELYVSGAGLHRYPLSLQTADHVGPPLQIADKTFFGTTPQLSVSCDPAASTIDVWALNGFDQLAHTTGYRISGTGARADGSAEDPTYTWDPALTLATEITALAAYRMPLPDRVDQPSGNPTEGAVAIAYRDHLALMTKNSELELWQETAVSLEAPDVAFDLNTFTTQITVTDDDNIAVADTQVLIRPSFDVPALVNGRYYALKSGIPKPAVTDPTGMVTIVLETSDLAAPVYDVTVGGHTQEEDPAAGLVAELRMITTPEQIYNAQRSDGGALFPDPADPDQLMSQCVAAVDGIEGLLIAYDRLDEEGARAGRVQRKRRGHGHGHGHGPAHGHEQHGHEQHGHDQHRHGHQPGHRVGHNASLTIGCHFASDGTVTVHKGRAALEALPAPDAWEWLEAVGDALKAAVDGVEQAVSWTLDIAEDAISFAIDLGNRIIAFVIDVLEQTLGVLDYVLQATLGISLSDILAWLGFLFNWGDVLDTHRVFSKMLDLVYPYVVSLTDTARQGVHEAVEWCRTSLLPIDENHPPYQGRARHSDAPTDPATNSPQVNWANRQFLVNAPAAKYDAGTAPYGDDPFANADDRVAADMAKIGDAVAETFAHGFATMDWAGAVNTMMNQIAGTFFDDAEYVVNLMFDAVETTVGNFQAMAAGHWDIPVLTWIYEHVVNPGGRLSLQDLGCLLAAIPATVAAKAATGQNCFDGPTASAILGADTWQEMITAVVNLPAAAPGSPAFPAGSTDPGLPNEDAVALARAAREVMIAGSLRIVGFVCYAVSNVPAVKRVYNVYGGLLLVKNIADWIAWAHGMSNNDQVEEIRPGSAALARYQDTGYAGRAKYPDRAQHADRAQHSDHAKHPAALGPSRRDLDNVVVVLGMLPLVRDMWLVQRMSKLRSVDVPGQAKVALLEVAYGITQLGLAATVVSWEYQEDAPPPTSTDDWHAMVGAKFGTNLSAALTSALAFEEAIPQGTLIQKGLAAVRAATQIAEIGCGIWVGRRGVELKQSDTGIG